ncbi:helix-turn-helix domain-containing protein [Thermopolyspora sp. NPDC052614]|uniref:TetR/AcrR family transcriptional regulator n=1 Tax=Thermopolyspora sp. NPDC052614 TaxID=3155682 RepID=UPI0034214E39
MTADPKTRLRADARRNRDHILAAAREMFAAQGLDIPMEEIARAAGVGVGTLYRRFPDRDSLILAVAQEAFTQVIDDARAAAAEEPTGWAALERLIGRSRGLQVSFQLAWSSARARDILLADPNTGRLRDALMAELARIVAAAQAEGTMRPDVGAGDIAVLLVLLLRQPPVGRGPMRFGLDRAVAIMLDGLRASSTNPLPGDPISDADLPFDGEHAAAMSRLRSSRDR